MLLSIIVPTYNRQKKLEIFLNSVSDSVKNDKRNSFIEVIVIDDFSSKLVTLPNFSFHLNLKRNHSNLGAPHSRRRGFESAQGIFIHFHDSDDNVSENWLSELIQHLQKNPETDILMTARTDVGKNKKAYKLQKFFHNHYINSSRIARRLVYRNCMGPLGGVTFSRRVLEKIEFKNFASCQDWQMYLDAIDHAKVLGSRPDIKFLFNKTGEDRISHNPRKKILGHLQLSRITAPKSPFGRNIRLFYLYTCKQHVVNKGGYILTFYKKNRLKIISTYILVSLYWRLT